MCKWSSPTQHYCMPNRQGAPMAHLQSWVTGWVMGPLCMKVTKALTLILYVLPCWTEHEIYGNSIDHLTSLSLCVHTFVVHCQPLCPKNYVCCIFILSVISCVISHRSIPRIYTHNNFKQDEFGMPVQLSTNAIIVTGVTQQAVAYDICKRIL